MLRIGSLFSGIGGLELGLERGTGGKTVFQVEQNKYAQAVLRKHWPDVPRFDDVRAVGRHNLPPCDILCGGFPCQDISVAGKGRGIEGERSGLWSEFARIIGETRPACIVAENVPALRTRGLGRVLKDLAALGYDAEWTCLGAVHVGAPHRRLRMFIVAYPSGLGWDVLRQDLGTVEPEAGTGTGAVGGHVVNPAANCGPNVADAFGQGLQGQRDVVAARHRDWWASEPPVGRVADGVPSRVDRLKCLGNSVVPQVAEVIGRSIKERAPSLPEGPI